MAKFVTPNHDRTILSRGSAPLASTFSAPKILTRASTVSRGSGSAAAAAPAVASAATTPRRALALALNGLAEHLPVLPVEPLERDALDRVAVNLASLHLDARDGPRELRVVAACRL